jgi:hypothetical protein
VQSAVRSLAAKAGVCTEEFLHGNKHGCCGFGGHALSADPGFADYVAKSRSALSLHPYITYCINCRDVFIESGKPVRHILDLLFNIDRAPVPDNPGPLSGGRPVEGWLGADLSPVPENPEPLSGGRPVEVSTVVNSTSTGLGCTRQTPWVQTPPESGPDSPAPGFDGGVDVGRLPSLAQRRLIRVLLKDLLLFTVWGEEKMVGTVEPKYTLLISDALRGKMDSQQLIDEDVVAVLDESARLGRRTFVAESDSFVCYAELDYITCWVEYRMDGDAYEIINVFSHRMKIELENMWNGRKTDADL